MEGYSGATGLMIIIGLPLLISAALMFFAGYEFLRWLF